MPSDATEALLSVLVFDSVLLLLTVLVFWAGVFVARRLGIGAGYGLGALGLAWPKAGYLAGAGLGIAFGIGALVASMLVTLLSTYVFERLGFSTESNVQEPLMRSVGEWVARSPQTAIPAAVFVIMIFAPAVEEIVFRGALFGGLYKLGSLLLTGRKGAGKGEWLSFGLAALFSSVVFASLHFEPVILPALLVLAVALCALYRWTGSILPTFAAHATFNSFAVLFIILGGLGVLPAQG